MVGVGIFSGTAHLTFSSELMGRQAWFVNWFCSSYLYINAKKDYNRFYIFLKDLRIFVNPSKFFTITRVLVTSLLCLV